MAQNGISELLDSGRQTGLNELQEKFIQRPLQYMHSQSTLPEELSKWFQAQRGQQSCPLLVLEHPLLPTQSLLLQWAKGHELEHRGKDRDFFVFILQGHGYTEYEMPHAVFRILMRLKSLLRISRKVDNHPENLRRYFTEWLWTVDKHIKNLALSEQVQEFSRNLTRRSVDAMLREEQLSFWLPQRLPSSVKLVATLRQGPRVILPRFCKTLKAELKPVSIEFQAQARLSEFKFAGKSIFHLVQKTIVQAASVTGSLYFLDLGLRMLLPLGQASAQTQQVIAKVLNKADIPQLQSVRSIVGLIEFVLQCWTHDQPELRSVVQVLVQCKNGFRLDQIKSIFQGEYLMLEAFLLVLQPFLLYISKERRLTIKNRTFAEALGPMRHGPSQTIRKTLGKNSFSLRGLHQLSYQLLALKGYTQLKELLSKMQNFVVLYNPYSKFQLCMFWKELVLRIGSDVVDQFVKGAYAFRLEFLPAEPDYYRILLQVSRFMKELADFPELQPNYFYHPRIASKREIFNDLQLLGEFDRLGLGVCLGEKDSKAELKKGRLMQKRKDASSWRGSLKQSMSEYKLSNIESHKGKLKFRNGYLSQLKQLLRQDGILKRNLAHESGPSDVYDFPLKFDSRDVLDPSRRPADCYFYKRWLWVTVPWLALSLKSNFSKDMGQFFNSQTETISIQRQLQVYNKVLSIAVGIKLQRLRIMESQLDQCGYLPKVKADRKPTAPFVPRQRSPGIGLIGPDSKAHPRKKVLSLPRISSSNTRVSKGLFITEQPAVQKQSNSKGRQLSIKKELSRVLSEAQIQDRIQSHNGQLRREVDLLKEANRRMARIILDEQKIPREHIQRQEEQRRQRVVRSIREKQGRLAQEADNNRTMSDAAGRMRLIIKLCQNNEYIHKEWLHMLNEFNTNLNKMIKLEQEGLTAFREEQKVRLELERKAFELRISDSPRQLRKSGLSEDGDGDYAGQTGQAELGEAVLGNDFLVTQLIGNYFSYKVREIHKQSEAEERISSLHREVMRKRETGLNISATLIHLRLDLQQHRERTEELERQRKGQLFSLHQVEPEREEPSPSVDLGQLARMTDAAERLALQVRSKLVLIRLLI